MKGARESVAGAAARGGSETCALPAQWMYHPCNAGTISRYQKRSPGAKLRRDPMVRAVNNPSIALDLETPLHPEQRVWIALEVVVTRLEGDLHVVRLTRELQEIAGGWKALLPRIRIGEEVDIVHARLEREAN